MAYAAPHVVLGLDPCIAHIYNQTAVLFRDSTCIVRSVAVVDRVDFRHELLVHSEAQDEGAAAEAGGGAAARAPSKHHRHVLVVDGDA